MVHSFEEEHVIVIYQKKMRLNFMLCYFHYSQPLEKELTRQNRPSHSSSNKHLHIRSFRTSKPWWQFALPTLPEITSLPKEELKNGENGETNEEKDLYQSWESSRTWYCSKGSSNPRIAHEFPKYWQPIKGQQALAERTAF